METGLTGQIKVLEERLLHADMREDPSLLDELLSENFEEIGSSGAINSRLAVVNWLVNKNKNDRWMLSDFRVSVLSTEIVLAIYQAQRITDNDSVACATIRSSIWKRHGRSWKMMFHQASRQCK